MQYAKIDSCILPWHNMKNGIVTIYIYISEHTPYDEVNNANQICINTYSHHHHHEHHCTKQGFLVGSAHSW